MYLEDKLELGLTIITSLPITDGLCLDVCGLELIRQELHHVDLVLSERFTKGTMSISLFAGEQVDLELIGSFFFLDDYLIEVRLFLIVHAIVGMHIDCLFVVSIFVLALWSSSTELSVAILTIHGSVVVGLGEAIVVRSVTVATVVAITLVATIVTGATTLATFTSWASASSVVTTSTISVITATMAVLAIKVISVLVVISVLLVTILALLLLLATFVELRTLCVSLV